MGPLHPSFILAQKGSPQLFGKDRGTMIKNDIVKRIAQHLKLKDSEALAVTDAIIDSIKETICEDDRLEIRDFGVFQTKIRKARIGRNPRNRKEYPIPPRRVVSFKLGKELKDFSLHHPGASDPQISPGDSGGAAGSAEPGPSGSSAVNQDSFLQGENE